MAKIVFGAVGAEGLGNISVDEEIGCLDNKTLDQKTATEVVNSHKTLSGREDGILLGLGRVVYGCYDILRPKPHINALDAVFGLRGPTMRYEM
jgi:hypothetical protein